MSWSPFEPSTISCTCGPDQISNFSKLMIEKFSILDKRQMCQTGRGKPSADAVNSPRWD